VKEPESTKRPRASADLPTAKRAGHSTPRLSARTILAILREQSIPDSEARRRVTSDPELSRELGD
jgi:hypothetical protein